MNKYTKIFEEINNDNWSNYCMIISDVHESDGCPEVYLCNNEKQAFIYLKNLICAEYKSYNTWAHYSKYLDEYSKASNLEELYEIFESRHRNLNVNIIYSDLNDDVKLDDWITKFELDNQLKKFNL